MLYSYNTAVLRESISRLFLVNVLHNTSRHAQFQENLNFLLSRSIWDGSDLVILTTDDHQASATITAAKGFDLPTFFYLCCCC